MGKYAPLIFYCVLGLVFQIEAGPLVGASEEFVVEVHNKYPLPQFPSQISVYPDGNVTDSNGMRYTIERYYCRKSPAGFLVKEIGTNWASLFRTIPDSSGGKIIANFQSEYMFRASKDSPLQYCADINSMTNEFKNGFSFFGQEASDIFAMSTGLGIGNTFETESGQSQGKNMLRLKLKVSPNIECVGRLTASNDTPTALDVLFTNNYGDLMGYHYEYENPNTLEGLSFNEIHLVVTNFSKGVFRFDRVVQLLSFTQGNDFLARSDFAFSSSPPNTNTWVWEGDKIKGMDEKLALVAKSGTTNGALSSRNVLVVRIILICFILLPPMFWLVRWIINKQKT